MVNTLKEVKNESTCQKRITICEIYDESGILLSRQSNRCNPKDGICQRLGIIQNKENYDIESTCNWIHAEINAINNLPKQSLPYKSILYGHDFYCNNCEIKLIENGVKILEISKKQI